MRVEGAASDLGRKRASTASGDRKGCGVPQTRICGSQPVVKSMTHLVVCQSTCSNDRSVHRPKLDPCRFLQFIGSVCLAKNPGAGTGSGLDRYLVDSHCVVEAAFENYCLEDFLDAEVVLVRWRWRKHIEQISSASHSKLPPNQLQKTLKHYLYLSFLLFCRFGQFARIIHSILTGPALAWCKATS